MSVAAACICLGNELSIVAHRYVHLSTVVTDVVFRVHINSNFVFFSASTPLGLAARPRSIMSKSGHAKSRFTYLLTFLQNLVVLLRVVSDSDVD